MGVDSFWAGGQDGAQVCCSSLSHCPTAAPNPRPAMTGVSGGGCRDPAGRGSGNLAEMQAVKLARNLVPAWSWPMRPAIGLGLATPKFRFLGIANIR